MNTNLLKKLATDSGVSLDKMGYGEGNIEEFADLIVQECIQVCLKERDPSGINYKPSAKFANSIRMHFGLLKG